LRLKKADDERLKKYLSEKVMSFKSKYETTEEELNKHKSQLSELEYYNKEVKEQMNGLDDKKDKQIEQIKKECDYKLLEARKGAIENEARMNLERDDLIAKIKQN